jgi:hypothetical protein
MRQGKEDARSDTLLIICELLLFVGRVNRSLRMFDFRCQYYHSRSLTCCHHHDCCTTRRLQTPHPSLRLTDSRRFDTATCQNSGDAVLEPLEPGIWPWCIKGTPAQSATTRLKLRRTMVLHMQPSRPSASKGKHIQWPSQRE